MQKTWVQALGQEDPLEREWPSTPVFFPGEFHGYSILMGNGLWCHKELDMTKWLTQHILLLSCQFPTDSNLKHSKFGHISISVFLKLNVLNRSGTLLITKAIILTWLCYNEQLYLPISSDFYKTSYLNLFGVFSALQEINYSWFISKR